ncbi:MAG TPA: hypothetical protein PKD53_14340 [Chloroflexaceae bacterium]|nr:hypothetical protein [Chloroflexaceae bacterium]
MDPNPFVNPPIGLIIFGLVIVLLLAAVIYGLGAWGAGKMRQGRVEDSTDIPYPDRPQSADDRETVAHARAEAAASDRVVSDQQIRELELGADRKVVPQTPTRGERPVDAADRDKDLHQIGPQSAGATSPAREQRDDEERSPL